MIIQPVEYENMQVYDRPSTTEIESGGPAEPIMYLRRKYRDSYQRGWNFQEGTFEGQDSNGSLPYVYHGLGNINKTFRRIKLGNDEFAILLDFMWQTSNTVGYDEGGNVYMADRFKRGRETPVWDVGGMLPNTADDFSVCMSESFFSCLEVYERSIPFKVNWSVSGSGSSATVPLGVNYIHIRVLFQCQLDCMHSF